MSGDPASATTQVTPSPVSLVGALWRGIVMGIAEVVPGVSGGTIAFVTGIYSELVGSLARFGPASLLMVRRPLQFWQHHNLRFLLALAAGMAVGVLAFAQLMHFLLAQYQPAVWGFFVGVIAMSVVVIGRARAPAALLVWAPMGLAAGLALLFLPQAGADTGWLRIFVGGLIAVCAWLLPAVSGSFVLLAMGLYGTVIDAVASLDMPVLLVLGGGCMCGIMAFSRALSWVLHHHGEPLLSFLTGFMLGSIVKLWPWQLSAASGFDALVGPFGYAAATGAAHLLLQTSLAVAAGGVALWLITRVHSD